MSKLTIRIDEELETLLDAYAEAAYDGVKSDAVRDLIRDGVTGTDRITVTYTRDDEVYEITLDGASATPETFTAIYETLED